MPVIIQTDYDPPAFFRNRHVNTIYPFLFRSVRGLRFSRERLELSDGDFLDLDWLVGGSRSLVIIAHGLESSSRASYVRGMARIFHEAGWDALAFNFRGCGGSPNRSLRFYHGGATGDLHEVIGRAVLRGQYRNIVLIGFSLGGNIILKYLGDGLLKIDPAVKAAVAVSVPIELSESAEAIDRPANGIYLRRFLNSLRKKIRAKMRLFPDRITDAGFSHIRSFRDFDDCYTAPIHGFTDAADYWRRCSSRQFLQNIGLPTLIIQAEDDPFLGPSCFPYREADESETLYLLMPRYGGHVGFVTAGAKGAYWSERKTLEFVRQWVPER